MPPRQEFWCPQASGAFPNWTYFFARTFPGIPKDKVSRQEVPVLLSKMHRQILNHCSASEFFYTEVE